MNRATVLSLIACVLAACGTADSVALPWPADIDVPELRVVGDLPDGALLIVLRADGQLELGGDVVGYVELGERLRSAGGVPVLIASDRRAPWGALLAVLQQCADPRTRIDRVFHAAVPVTGGAPGAFGTCFPAERGSADGAHPAAPHLVRVEITAELPPSEVLGLHAEFAKSDRPFVVEVDADRSTRVQYVLQVADVAALESAEAFWFAGTRPPRSDAEFEDGVARWLRGDLARHIRVFGHEVGSPPGIVPPGERVVGELAGFASPYSGPEPWAPPEVEGTLPPDDH